MQQDRVEEYLGAIYRLREDAETPVPLSRLATYFGFSPVSVHEMVQKLSAKGSLLYHPYRGVTLTEPGEQAAARLMRRHLLWERFLTETLDIPWSEAHEVAGRLEHVATGLITERLAAFLGVPPVCDDPGQDGGEKGSAETCLPSVPVGSHARVIRIAPEIPARLRRLRETDVVPGRSVKVLSQDAMGTEVLVAETGSVARVGSDDAGSVWLELSS